MIDLKSKREANKKRLLGIVDDDIAPYTAQDVLSSPEICWDIISMCVRKGTEEVTRKDGVKYTKQSKDYKWPELAVLEVVGERKTTTKGAKSPVVFRTNLSTMEEMYETRNAMIRHYEDDLSEAYIEYFESVVEVLDGYALQVVADMVESINGFLDKVNSARGVSQK